MISILQINKKIEKNYLRPSHNKQQVHEWYSKFMEQKQGLQSNLRRKVRFTNGYNDITYDVIYIKCPLTKIINFLQVDAMNTDYDYLFKFILVGQSSVGKSCLLLRFLQSRFKNEHEATLGVEFGAKVSTIDEQKIKLQVWDTAGQESFRSITRAYYRGSIAALLVFDLTSLSTFQSLEHWLKELKTYSHTKLRICLIGNKVDLKSQREISQSAILDFMKVHNIQNYLQTSALTGENSDTPFLQMGRVILKAINQGLLKPQEDGALGIKPHPKKNTGAPPIKAFIDFKDKETTQKEKENCAC